MAVMRALRQSGRLVILVFRTFVARPVALLRVASALMRCGIAGAGGVVVFGVMLVGRVFRLAAILTAAGRGLSIGAGCTLVAVS